MDGPAPATAPPDARAYLEWELALLHRRLEALLAARAAGRDAEIGLAEAMAALDAERARGLHLRAERCAAGELIPLAALAARYGLAAEVEPLLLLAAAADLSAPLHQLIVHVQTAVGRRWLDVELACELLWFEPRLGSLLAPFLPESPLVAHGLLTLTAPPPDHPDGLLAMRCRTAGFVTRFLSEGRFALDPQLRDVAALTGLAPEPSAYVVDRGLAGALERVLQGLRGLERTRGVGVVALVGAPDLGQARIAADLAARLARPLLTLRLEHLRSADDALAAVPLAVANARFADAVLHVTGVDEARERLPALEALLDAALQGGPLPVLIDRRDAGEPRPLLDRLATLALALRFPDADARLELWEEQLPPELPLADDVDVRRLADTYRLSVDGVVRAAAWARQTAGADGCAVDQAHLEHGAALQLEGPGTGPLTSVRHQPLTLDDVVLDPVARAKVLELEAACRHRATVLSTWGLGRRLTSGKGIVALFAGEAGTGKTLTAEVLASTLGLELRVVAVPSIVSKWVGETEKHLTELFARAQARRALLLFDEADSLFTTRVKIERAQDHFQNLEVNTLLQEIERFDGVVILTTNLETNIDKAFQRRILYRIEFKAPDVEARRRIWQALMPPDAPRAADLDVARLAREFDLTGGQIRNAIVQASYACCAAGAPLTTSALEQAAHAQAQAAGKLVRAPAPSAPLPRPGPRP